MFSYIKIESVLSEQTTVLIYEYIKFADKKCKLILEDKPGHFVQEGNKKPVWRYFYNEWEHGAYDDKNVPDVFSKYGDMLLEEI